MPHVVRGHLSEVVARERLERETLTAYRPKYWQHPTVEYFTASDDGYAHEVHHTIEVKAMGKANHARAKGGEIPPHYMDQMQWGLMISGCEKCIFISYRVEDDDMVCIDVFPDKKLQDELVAAAHNFWLNHVMKDIPPPITDGDYKELTDAALVKVVTEFKELHAQSKILEAKIEDCKERMKPYTAVQPAVMCAGVKMLRTSQQGRIDYKRYAADGNVSNETLEKYRGKPVESFRVFVPNEIYIKT